MTFYTVATTKSLKSKFRCFHKSHERLHNICGHYAVQHRITCLKEKGFRCEPQLAHSTAV